MSADYERVSHEHSDSKPQVSTGLAAVSASGNLVSTCYEETLMFDLDFGFFF